MFHYFWGIFWVPRLIDEDSSSAVVSFELAGKPFGASSFLYRSNLYILSRLLAFKPCPALGNELALALHINSSALLMSFRDPAVL